MFSKFFGSKPPVKNVAQPQRVAPRVSVPVRPKVIIDDTQDLNSGEDTKNQSQSATGANDVLCSYAEIGNVRKNLTAVGDGAVYAINANLQDQIAALDKGDKKVWLICNSEPTITTQEMSGHIRQLTGALRSRGYQVAMVVKALPQVMTEVAKAGTHQISGPTDGRGEPLELFNRWVDAAAAVLASDLHILIYSNQASVKVRVDGSLEPLKIDANGIYARGTAISAIAAGFNYATRGSGSAASQYTESVAVDCMIEREINGKTVLLRYQNMPAPPGGKEYGPKVVIRLLQSEATGVVGNFEHAGYSQSHCKLWRLSSRAGKGMTIVSGVTGSGKSTSLKIYIETLPDLEKKAVETIEDPIEYVIAPGKVHQGQVTRDLSSHEETRKRYGVAMKALMRADIDAVLVGEVRDDITARFLLQVAETGHLGMCSLHAHLISNIVPRLTNEEVGLSRQELTSPQILNLLVYQALVPLLCKHCNLSTQEASRLETEGEISEICHVLKDRLEIQIDNLRWKNPMGCSHCDGRGTKGRTMVAEMWMPDREWLSHVRNGCDYEALMHYRSFSDGDFNSPNMTGKTVFEHALFKSLQGIIDVRNCEEFEGFERYEKFDQIKFSREKIEKQNRI